MRPPAKLAYSLAVFTYMFNVGSIGSWIPLYARDLGFTYTQVTGLATVYFSVLLPATLALGILADLTGRPKALTVGGIILAGLTALGLAHSASFPALAAIRGLQALGLAMILPLSVGALTRALGVREGVRLAAALQGAGMASGAILAGILYGEAGWPAVAYSYSGISLAVAVVIAASEPPPKPPRPASLGEIAEALRKAPTGVKVVLGVLLARNTFATGAFSILSVIFSRIVGLSTLYTGLALAVNPAVQAVAAGPSSRLSRGREVATYALGVAATGLIMHAYALASSAPLIMLAQVLQGVSFSIINVSANNYIISRMPEEVRFTAASLFPLAFNGGWIAGTAIAGPFMDALGVRAWLYIAGLGCYLLGLGTLAWLYKVERRV